MNSINHYREEFLAHLKTSIAVKEPQNLYEPIDYILQLGGKRLRPVLTLIAADLFGGDYRKALPAAAAVEVFHNFSLVHDDIMDNASLRRGKATVHQKWNSNIAILSGDAMLICAYRLLESYPAETFAALAKLFSKTALEVCEGQQRDMDFETQAQVSIPQYLQMIRYKTAVLVGAALQMGAIIAGASIENQRLIYDFGVTIGLAFQLQDDYLDAFGDEAFGKKIGGDILENKKTILYLKALDLADEAQRDTLIAQYTTSGENDAKIAIVTQLFRQTGAAEAVRDEIARTTDEALNLLEHITISDENRAYLKQFALELMNRKV